MRCVTMRPSGNHMVRTLQEQIAATRALKEQILKDDFTSPDYRLLLLLLL